MDITSKCYNFILQWAHHWHHLASFQESLTSSCESSLGSEVFGPLPGTTLADLTRVAVALLPVQSSLSLSPSSFATHSLSQSTSSSSHSTSRSQSPSKLYDNKCYICSYKTNRRSNLIRHLETMHRSQDDYVRVELFLCLSFQQHSSLPRRASSVATRCSLANLTCENIKSSYTAMVMVVSSVPGHFVGMLGSWNKFLGELTQFHFSVGLCWKGTWMSIRVKRILTVSSVATQLVTSQIWKDTSIDSMVYRLETLLRPLGR